MLITGMSLLLNKLFKLTTEQSQMAKIPRPDLTLLKSVQLLWAEYRKVSSIPTRLDITAMAEGLQQATDALISGFLKQQGINAPTTDLDCRVEDYQILVFDDTGEITHFYWHMNSVNSRELENFNLLNFKKLDQLKEVDWSGTTFREQAENDRAQLIHAACEEVLGCEYAHTLDFEWITSGVLRIYDTGSGDTVLAIHL